MVIIIVLLDDTFTCMYFLTHSGGGTHEHSRATTYLDNYQLTHKQLKAEYMKIQPAVTSVVRLCTCDLGASLLSISLVYSHSHA